MKRRKSFSDKAETIRDVSSRQRSECEYKICISSLKLSVSLFDIKMLFE